MKARLCRHIKSDGIQCHAVAMLDSPFCYFHKRLDEGHRLYRTAMLSKRSMMDRGFVIGLPALEDRVAIQLALSEVINALACNFIDNKRALALIYGLQVASTNCKGVDPLAQPKDMVRDCTSAPDLIENVGVDLAPLGRTVDIPEPELIPDLAGDPDPIGHLKPRVKYTPAAPLPSLAESPEPAEPAEPPFEDSEPYPDPDEPAIADCELASEPVAQHPTSTGSELSAESPLFDSEYASFPHPLLPSDCFSSVPS